MLNMNELSYAQAYRLKRSAKELGMTLEDYVSSGKARLPRTIGAAPIPPKQVDLKIAKLSELSVNHKMFRNYSTGLPIDHMFSYEGGIPVATNALISGDPGTGKTTISLYALANLKITNPELKCLFLSFEMGQLQMYKYTKRFPVFGELDTLFSNDYMEDNSKDVIEQALSSGYDYVLIDSIAEVLGRVRDDNGWSLQQAEKWLIDTCVKHNKANYTTFLLIQQVSKNGIFTGSNKVLHLVDSHMQLKKKSEKEGGGTHMFFSKNRNGECGVNYDYTLYTDRIQFGFTTDETNTSGPLELVANL